MATNPVFNRIDREAERGYAGFGRAPQQAPAPSWGQAGTMTDQQLQDLYNQPSATPVQAGRVTLDDVVMKTLGLFSLVLVFAVVGWRLAPTSLGGVVMLGGIALTLVLGLVIAFKKTISVPLIVTYAVVEGLFVGAISNYYSLIFDGPNVDDPFKGIVAQAVIATLSVFAGMLLAYKTGLIKVTEKFRRVVTMDDVVMKTAGLFTLMLVFAGIGWALAPTNLGGVVILGGIAATLVLGLVIAFKKTISVPLIVGYAMVEGLMVGAISFTYSTLFDPRGTPVFEGIVAQAVLGTLSVFAGMLLAYKTGLIKVTAKFRRIVTMAVIGYAIFALINLGYVLFFHGSMFGFGGSGGLGIVISLFAIGLASLSLAVDFDSIDRAIAAGAPQKYSWLLAHGLIVTLVWLYLELLRLLGRLRSQ
ncbi:MAG: Bax inhibitor-1/YccA family membrane protein [Actinomycetes bacterium]